MKTLFKILLIAIGLIILVFIGLTAATVFYYTGDSEFTEAITGTWEAIDPEMPLAYEIYKGSREVRGYTYGYFQEINTPAHSYRIRYKDKTIEFLEEDTDQFLRYDEHKNQLEGEICIPTIGEEQLVPIQLRKIADE